MKDKNKTHQNVPQEAEAVSQLIQSQAIKDAGRSSIVVINKCVIASFVGVLSFASFFFFPTNQDAVFGCVY